MDSLVANANTGNTAKALMPNVPPLVANSGRKLGGLRLALENLPGIAPLRHFLLALLYQNRNKNPSEQPGLAQAVGLKLNLQNDPGSYWHYRTRMREKLTYLNIQKPEFVGNLLRGLQAAALPVYLSIMPALVAVLIFGPTGLYYWLAAGSGLGLLNTILTAPLISVFFRPLTLLAMFAIDKAFEPIIRWPARMCNEHLKKMASGIEEIIGDVQLLATNQAAFKDAEQIMAAYLDQIMESIWDLGKLAGMQELVKAIKFQILSPFFCSKLERQFAQLKEILVILSEGGKKDVNTADLVVNGEDLLGVVYGSLNSLLSATETLAAHCPNSMKPVLNRILVDLTVINQKFKYLIEDISKGCRIDKVRDNLAGIFFDVASIAYVINNLEYQIQHINPAAETILDLVNFKYNNDFNNNSYGRLMLALQALEQLKNSPYYISRATPQSAVNKLKWFIKGGFLGINRDAGKASDQFGRYRYGSDMSAETMFIQLVHQALNLAYHARYGLTSGSKFDRFLNALNQLKESIKKIADPQAGSQILGLGPFAYMLHFATNGLLGFFGDKVLFSPLSAFFGAVRGQR